MQLKKQIFTFSQLGDYLLDKTNDDQIKTLISAARNENGWFTEDNVRLSLENIAKIFLNTQFLEHFIVKHQPNEDKAPKKVGVVMAGNIPAVGFHDLLCVVLSGNIALIKLSSSDVVLMKFMVNKLFELNPDFRNLIQIVDRLNDADALIATGSDNTAKHFEYYFAKKPHIIRRNRSSVAILRGDETRTDLGNLGNDIFQYFGLGCRNVSKLYVPKGYIFDKFYEAIEYWNTICLHHKYNNNYDYNKSILLVNGVKHLDNGFLLLKNDEALVSPISVCFWETYNDEIHLKNLIESKAGKIQCIVSKDGYFQNSCSFGEAQMPNLDDFADGVDTMEFLKNI
jgi:hypothetical protein